MKLSCNMSFLFFDNIVSPKFNNFICHTPLIWTLICKWLPQRNKCAYQNEICKATPLHLIVNHCKKCLPVFTALELFLLETFKFHFCNEKIRALDLFFKQNQSSGGVLLKTVLENIATSTGKHLFRSFLLNKLHASCLQI